MKKIATMALVAASMTFAQTPSTSTTPTQPSHHASRQDQMMRSLGLSEAQKEKARAIFQKSRQESEPVQAQMRKNREELQAAIRANDKAKIKQITSQQGTLRGELLSMRADTRAKFDSILTPEQRVKAEQMRREAARRKPWVNRSGAASRLPE